MGVFGTGGLHKSSTWLRPVATFADLPTPTFDGAVAVTLDTNEIYEFDGATNAWIPTGSGGGPGTRIYGEVPAGAIDGANTVYTTANPFVPGTEAVYFNGVRLQQGASSDYVRSESSPGFGYDTITLAFAPRSRPGAKPDDKLMIDYNPL